MDGERELNRGLSGYRANKGSYETPIHIQKDPLHKLRLTVKVLIFIVIVNIMITSWIGYKLLKEDVEHIDEVIVEVLGVDTNPDGRYHGEHELDIQVFFMIKNKDLAKDWIQIKPSIFYQHLGGGLDTSLLGYREEELHPLEEITHLYTYVLLKEDLMSGSVGLGINVWRGDEFLGYGGAGISVQMTDNGFFEFTHDYPIL